MWLKIKIIIWKNQKLIKIKKRTMVVDMRNSDNKYSYI